MKKKISSANALQGRIACSPTMLLGAITLLLVFGNSASRAQMPGYKYQAKITPEGKAFVVVAQPYPESGYVGVLGNGNVIEVLQKKDNWLEVLLPFGRKGWVQYLPTGVDWQWDLISLGAVAKPEPVSSPAPPEENKTPNTSPPAREPQPEQNARAYEDLLRRVLALEKRVLLLEAKALTAATPSSVAPVVVIAKPSNEEIEEAVRAYLKREVPISWVGNLMGGENAQVDLVEVKDTGVYNDQQRYWPMRIRCIGSCRLRDPFNPGRIATFDRVGEFVLFKDDYGKWKAELRGGLFQ